LPDPHGSARGRRLLAGLQATKKPAKFTRSDAEKSGALKAPGSTAASGAKRPFQTSAASGVGVLRDRNDLKLLTGCTYYIPNSFAYQKPCNWGYEGN
jgi:hypothetical protein